MPSSPGRRGGERRRSRDEEDLRKSLDLRKRRARMRSRSRSPADGEFVSITNDAQCHAREVGESFILI